MINRAHNAGVVSAWEVDELPDEWLYAAEKYVVDLPDLQRGRGKVEAAFAAWRSRHPTYRKHMRH